jgi:hypothetical protein
MKEIITLWSVILTATLYSACSEHPCSSDNDYERLFISHINYIEKYHNGEWISDDSLFQSYAFLCTETGLESNVSKEYTMHYKNDSMFEVDKDGWMKWLEENPCGVK